MKKTPNGPNEFIRRIAREYASDRRLKLIEDFYFEPKESLLKKLAVVFLDAKKFDESDYKIKASYEQFKLEIVEQFKFIQSKGIAFEIWPFQEQPYQDSASMCLDLTANRHLYVFVGGEPHPILSESSSISGFSYNSLFRAIHDVFGHAAEGFSFGPNGEENAWIKHSQMFSPLAHAAMTTETRSISSVFYFGPQNYLPDGTNKNIPFSKRPYPEQKAFLTPSPYLDWSAYFN